MYNVHREKEAFLHPFVTLDERDAVLCAPVIFGAWLESTLRKRTVNIRLMSLTADFQCATQLGFQLFFFLC